MFGPDTTVGESAANLSITTEFTGHDFDVHFACLFNSISLPDVGLFGKVRVDDEEGKEFSFNLIKVKVLATCF